MKSVRDSFLNDGHVTLRQFLSNEIKNTVTEVIYHNFKNALELNEFSSFNLEDEDFHLKLTRFRTDNPSAFGEIYDNINLNARYRSIFYNANLLDLFSDTLGVSKNLIFINGVMLRLDAPFDTRNNLDWHQDSPYYMMSYPEFNSGVCWMAVTQNTDTNGTLVFIPHSHSTHIKKISTKTDNFSSEQFRLTPTTDELHYAINLDQEFGDLTLLHMNIKHRSGTNSSTKFRITMGCRFHDMTKSFNSGKEIFEFNNPSALR